MTLSLLLLIGWVNPHWILLWYLFFTHKKTSKYFYCYCQYAMNMLILSSVYLSWPLHILREPPLGPHLYQLPPPVLPSSACKHQLSCHRLKLHDHQHLKRNVNESMREKRERERERERGRHCTVHVHYSVLPLPVTGSCGLWERIGFFLSFSLCLFNVCISSSRNMGKAWAGEREGGKTV